MAHIPESSNLSLPAEPRLAPVREAALETQVAITDGITAALSSDVSTPIAVLFPELLVRIFHFLMLSSSPTFDFWDEKINPGWISSTTHVCRYWRQVALASPALWTDIAFDLGPRWLEEMVARSKAAPLSLSYIGKLHSKRLPDHEIQHLIITELARAWELSIHGVSDLANFFESLQSLPAPILEILRLYSDVNDAASMYRPIRSSVHPAFFECKALRIRELSLTDLGYSWVSIPTVALKFLNITFLTNKLATIPMSPHALDEFINFLECTPTLEHLILREGLPHNVF